jgi:hypothetical protein
MGWLQHFLNCISRLLREAAWRAYAESTERLFLFFSYSARYTVFCRVVISMSMMFSWSGGIDDSTSSF